MATNPTVIFPEAGEVTVENRPVPEPEMDEVLVESDRTLISTGTELTVLSGYYPEGSHWDDYGTYPHEPGYCTAGTVVKAGSAVDSVETGQRVALQGSHSRYNVENANVCRPIPDGVTDDEAAFGTIAEIVMNGVRRSRLDWGETAVIYGAGLLGQFATRFCHTAGSRPVVALDLADDRLDYLPDDEGVRTLNPGDDDPESAVRQANHGRLANVVFEVTGNPTVIPQELDVLERRGRLVLLSSPHGETEFDFHDHCNWPSYEIIGAHITSHPETASPDNPWTHQRNAELYFEYLLDRSISVDELVSHREDYTDAPDLYRMLLEDRSQTMGVLLEW